MVHFAKTAFATTSARAFLWFILQKLLLRPLPQKLSCGSFCENRICDHFRKSFLVVHFAKTSYATTSLDTFLWFILQKLLLRPLPQKLSCGSFCKNCFCSHFHGNSFAKTPFLCKRCSCAYSLLSPAGQRVVGKRALRRFLAALETAMLFRGPTPGWRRQGGRCMEVTGLVPVTMHRVDRPRTNSFNQGGFLEPLGTGAPLPRPLPLTAGVTTASMGRRSTA